MVLSQVLVSSAFLIITENHYEPITYQVTLSVRIIALYHDSRPIIVCVVGCSAVLASITFVSVLSPLGLLLTHYLRLSVVLVG
jgi:hypothetical protein